ncbi:MAG: hypothetical protein DMF81_19290 [Acidobacteria bacterium]|nr:MAG: hypothetical protein DMF81_19290 [Acidobacteriota bacterium]
MWLTETADAACGGNPWASSFLDTFRYLDQLGRLARQGVQVVAHNTLVASDYGLLDEGDLTPKPKRRYSTQASPFAPACMRMRTASVARPAASRFSSSIRTSRRHRR